MCAFNVWQVNRILFCRKHDDDSDYDSEYEEDGRSNPDWEKELEEGLAEIKKEAMAGLFKGNKDNPGAMTDVPDGLQQYIPSEMQVAYQAQNPL